MTSYLPTAIVLAKVKGYPAWPAMVLDESLLPSHILSKQPKSKSSTTSTTIKKIVPVRFFSDDTYIWININDLKPLSKEDIQKYFDNSNLKRKIDQLLHTAYELANDPPDMKQFIQYGSKGVPEVISDEEDDEILSIPAKRKKQQIQSPKKKPTKEITKVKKETPKAKPKAPPKPKAKPKPIVEEFDNDWGLDDFNKYDKASGNYIYNTEEEQIRILSRV